MISYLLNVRTPRGPIVLAFAGAILVHLGAVALAEIRPTETSPPMQPADPIIDLIGDPIPEPSRIEEMQPTASPPVADPFMAEDTPSPPKKPSTPPRGPLVRPAQPNAVARNSGVRALVAPRPEYPYEARRQRLTGSGVAELNIDRASGVVTDVVMVRSTGSSVLDHATISGLRRWRFAPGTVSRVHTPVTYTLMGASF